MNSDWALVFFKINANVRERGIEEKTTKKVERWRRRDTHKKRRKEKQHKRKRRETKLKTKKNGERKRKKRTRKRERE